MVVASIHSYPNYSDFSERDKSVTRDNPLQLSCYIIFPGGGLQVYSNNGKGYVTSTVAKNISTRKLSTREKELLKQQYQEQWEAHSKSGCKVGCANMTWPTP